MLVLTAGACIIPVGAMVACAVTKLRSHKPHKRKGGLFPGEVSMGEIYDHGTVVGGVENPLASGVRSVSTSAARPAGS